MLDILHPEIVTDCWESKNWLESEVPKPTRGNCIMSKGPCCQVFTPTNVFILSDIGEFPLYFFWLVTTKITHYPVKPYTMNCLAICIGFVGLISLQTILNSKTNVSFHFLIQVYPCLWKMIQKFGRSNGHCSQVPCIIWSRATIVPARLIDAELKIL